ncbi:MAG TPA: O-antigen ligase family protein [Planctomycetota bacterium]|nr:O-antigen ligase family protein [Planctomycetota bacterium]
MRDLPIRFNPARVIGYRGRRPRSTRASADVYDPGASTLITEEQTPSIAYFFLLAFVFFSFAQLAAWLPGHPKPHSGMAPTGLSLLAVQMRLSLLSSVLAMACIVFHKFTRGQMILFAGPQVYLMGAFVLLGLALVPFSVHPTYSLKFVLSDMVKLFLLFLLVTNVVRNLASVRGFLWALLLCGCIPAVGALLANLWPDQFALSRDASGRIGWASYFGNPNRLAQTMCQLIPVALCLIPLARSYAVKVLLAGLIGLFLLVMLLMFSRIAMITMVMVALVYCVSSRHKIRNLTVVGVIGLCSIAAVPGAVSRAKTIATYEQDASAMGRIYLWRAGLAMVARHPLTGIGVDAFPLAMADYFASRGPHARLRWMWPHNAYIQAVAEMGIFGLLTFVGLLWVSLRDARRLHKRLSDASDPPAQELAMLARGLFLAMIANCIIGLTSHIAYDWTLHMYGALIVCLKQIARPSAAGEA